MEILEYVGPLFSIWKTVGINNKKNTLWLPSCDYGPSEQTALLSFNLLS